jgi:hypothetical protein
MRQGRPVLVRGRVRRRVARHSGRGLGPAAVGLDLFEIASRHGERMPGAAVPAGLRLRVRDGQRHQLPVVRVPQPLRRHQLPGRPAMPAGRFPMPRDPLLPGSTILHGRPAA